MSVAARGVLALVCIVPTIAGFLTIAGCADRAASQPDLVVLVTIDTLRADHLELYGYPRSTAPFLGRLAADGVVFENVAAPVSHTAPSHASMMTGLYPLRHGMRDNGLRSLPTAAPLAS